MGKTSGGSNALYKEIPRCLTVVWIWLPFNFCPLIPTACTLWCCWSALGVSVPPSESYATVIFLCFIQYNGWRISWNTPKHGLFITKKPAVRGIVPFGHQIRVGRENTVSGPKSSPAPLWYLELLSFETRFPSFQLFCLCAFVPCLIILGQVCNSWTEYSKGNALWSSYSRKICTKR